MAKALAEAGADLVLAARTVSSLEKLTETLKRPGKKSMAIRADVSKLPETQAMVDRKVE